MTAETSCGRVISDMRVTTRIAALSTAAVLLALLSLFVVPNDGAGQPAASPILREMGRDPAELDSLLAGGR